MRKALLLLLLAVSAVALADDIAFNPFVQYQFINCSSDGGYPPAQVIAEGRYVVSVTDKNTLLCFHVDGGGNCIDGGIGGGMMVPAGAVFRMSFGRNKSLACTSSDSTGDVYLMQTY